MVMYIMDFWGQKIHEYSHVLITSWGLHIKDFSVCYEIKYIESKDSWDFVLINPIFCFSFFHHHRHHHLLLGFFFSFLHLLLPRLSLFVSDINEGKTFHEIRNNLIILTGWLITEARGRAHENE